MSWDRFKKFLATAHTWTGVQTFASAVFSSVTVTSGTISGVTSTGPASIATDSATGNVTATQMEGQEHVVTGAYVLSLPSATVGLRATFYASTAAAFSLDVVTGTDVIILNGIALAAGNKATSDGTINNTMQVVCRVAGKYVINSLVGLAIDGGA